jgi:hypothetical protein
MEKPLLRARPVRDIPKSTPRLNPPLHLGSLFRRRALGGSSFTEIALVLAPYLGVWADDSGREAGAFFTLGRAQMARGC